MARRHPALAGVPLASAAGEPAADPQWGEPGLSAAEKVLAWNSFEVLAWTAGDPDDHVADGSGIDDGDTGEIRGGSIGATAERGWSSGGSDDWGADQDATGVDRPAEVQPWDRSGAHGDPSSSSVWDTAVRTQGADEQDAADARERDDAADSDAREHADVDVWGSDDAGSDHADARDDGDGHDADAGWADRAAAPDGPVTDPAVRSAWRRLSRSPAPSRSTPPARTRWPRRARTSIRPETGNRRAGGRRRAPRRPGPPARRRTAPAGRRAAARGRRLQVDQLERLAPLRT